jgi:uncharacterized protein with HEPN domain
MLDYISDIQTFTQTMDEAAFRADRKTQLAVIRAFEVIGEAAKRLPQPLLDTQAELNWKAVKGFRDVLIHQYDNIDLKIVWEAVGKVPDLHKAVLSMQTSIKDENDDTN